VASREILSFENKVQGALGSLSNFFSRIFEEISYQFKQKNKMAKKFHFTQGSPLNTTKRVISVQNYLFFEKKGAYVCART